MLDIAQQFPVTQNHIYLNHAAMAPWPLVTEQALQQFVAENVRHGSTNYPQWSLLERELRQRLQLLLNAPSIDDIGLIHNTSVGISFVAEGIDWQAGDNVISIAQEFPSNRYPWLAQSYRGVTVKELDLNTCGEDVEGALLALCDARTRVVAISAIQFGTGLRLNLKRIGEYCKTHQIIFCVDGIQQVGMMPLDVQAIHADFVIADAHKWLLGPEGIAVFYVSPKQREQLRLTQFGWHMMETMGNYTSPEFIPSPTARRFEAGSPNMLGIHALHASMGLIMEVGIEAIWAAIQERMQILIQGFQATEHLEILTNTSAERLSGIITVCPTVQSSEGLFEYLKTNKVFTAPRGGGVRFSPHFYTPLEQVKEAVQLVREYLA
ncbi:aminotransferase class V-fold PLP-dependent enzyme [Thiofilum flexile]|uniref:aminotransferase class V-fold PLP-dependent enzyme n=1 Tax=Thiofilum flexile TaxID=125627 RepID=UPI000361A850|nr:aminotransferase class V-fold PLP-dependent enzyme [Thiofilum flexile]